jgi:hypothetical protein
MRLALVLLLSFLPLRAGLAADPPGPSGDAALIRSIAEGADHPVVFTGVVRSRTAKNENAEPYWSLKIRSVKMLLGSPRETIEVAVPCVFYFKDGFQRVTTHFDPVYPAYSEQPQLFFPGDRVLMVAQFQDKTPANPQPRWTVILTRFLGDDADRLWSQDLFFLNGVAADSLLYFNSAVPADSLFCRRVLQPGPTTLAEVKTVLAEMAATPAKKTP